MIERSFVWPTSTHLLIFDTSNCSTRRDRIISNSSFTIQSDLFVGFGNRFLLSLNTEMRVFDRRTGVTSLWSPSRDRIAGIEPRPSVANLSVDLSGQLWFFDTWMRLWRGDFDGQFTGFADLSSIGSGELSNVRKIIETPRGLHLIQKPFDRHTLEIFTFDVAVFERRPS